GDEKTADNTVAIGKGFEDASVQIRRAKPTCIPSMYALSVSEFCCLPVNIIRIRLFPDMRREKTP
ncbi:MAG: hypothetical protein SOV18_03775, partial [Eubacteriales bacterium]|nr:hypothetical protein [Eubacteriales bacterium]